MKITYIGPKKFKKKFGGKFDPQILNEVRAHFNNFHTIHAGVFIDDFKKDCEDLAYQYQHHFTNDCIIIFGHGEMIRKDYVNVTIINSAHALEVYKKINKIKAFL